jgi:hypothetical protein
MEPGEIAPVPSFSSVLDLMVWVAATAVYVLAGGDGWWHRV